MLATIAMTQSQAWHDSGLFLGIHWLWWSFWVAAVLLVLWAFWRLLAENRARHSNARRREEAESILRRRFAAGEIDEEELVRRLRTLDQTDPSAVPSG